ncbi:MAG: nucleoside triphosphate pyrophosphohydrolase [Alphaproteobacteria bacterium]|nr:nucleoside triphosphate pyrophosphohydrolase [Alphaproteobacteria bacterium]
MTKKPENAETGINRLLDIMRQLRDPETGCPWDREQSFETIAPYTIEEAYEVAETIADGDMDEFCNELGDLLFQVVFYARIAAEKKLFDFNDVVQGISDKMVTRHPHIFGNEDIEDAEAQNVAWETSKAREREAKARAKNREPSVLDDVTAGFPALMRAQKLQKRATRIGFDWPDVTGALDKLEEEVAELNDEVQSGVDQTRINEEFGDVMFSLVNIGRHYKLDVETSLRQANTRFETRFRLMETLARDNHGDPTTASLEELEALWQVAKQELSD